jgi:hypothetical protein
MLPSYIVWRFGAARFHRFGVFLLNAVGAVGVRDESKSIFAISVQTIGCRRGPCDRRFLAFISVACGCRPKGCFFPVRLVVTPPTAQDSRLKNYRSADDLLQHSKNSEAR